MQRACAASCSPPRTRKRRAPTPAPRSSGGTSAAARPPISRGPMPDLDLRMPRARLTQARQGATVVVTTPAMFRVTGAGALTCLQGLLTNDLVQPGDGSLVYGALLTPKGAIVVDAWV